MARTDDTWKEGIDGTYIEPTSPFGFNILVKGNNKYINFNTLTGFSGYGFRDNDGVIEFKDFNGFWSALSNVGAPSFATLTGSPYDNANLTTALNTKADKTFAIAMSLALG